MDFYLFNSSSPGPSKASDGGNYSYQHRRYQEFFFAKKLKELYETKPVVLRDLKVLSNHEFFYDIFLKYLKQEYLKQRNLSRLLKIDLINVYSGKHRGWGADNPYYVNSSEFIPSLACQQIDSLEQLMEDENLGLKSKILIDINYLDEQFRKWKKDKKNWRTNDYLKNV